MSKEEFLNLVINAYNSALKMKEDSQKQIEYYSSIDSIKELEQAKRDNAIAINNIERLKSIILLPLYERISRLTDDEIKEYNNSLINIQANLLKKTQSELSDLKNEEDNIVVLQKENLDEFSNEFDEEKREELLKSGKEIQKKLTEIKVNILQREHEEKDILKSISILRSKTSEDIRESLIQELGLENLKQIKDNSNFSKYDELIYLVAGDNDRLNMLIEKLTKYKHLNDEEFSYTLDVSSSKVLDLIDESISKHNVLLVDNKLTVSSKSNWDGLKGSLTVKEEKVQRIFNDLERRKYKTLSDFDYVYTTLSECSSLTDVEFKKAIEEIITLNPEFSSYVNNDIGTLQELNSNFLVRTFNGNKIKTVRKDIMDTIYMRMSVKVDEFMTSLYNDLKFMQYNNLSINTFNSNGEVKDSIDKYPLMIKEILKQIPSIKIYFDEVIKDLSKLTDKVLTSNMDLKSKILKKNEELDNLEKEINQIVGRKLDTDELKVLVNKLTDDKLEENLSEVSTKKVIRNITYAPNYDISIDELKEFKNDLDITEDELESSSKKM